MTRKSIIKLIDKILEHNYFKIVSISIITSFAIFHGISYVRNNFHQKERVEEKSQIKINLINSKEKLKEIEDQRLEYSVRSNESLSEILYSLGADKTDIDNILNATKKIVDPRLVRPGQELVIFYKTIITYKDNDPSQGLVRHSIISKISLSPDPEMYMFVNRNKDGSYSSQKTKKELVKKVTKYSGTIHNSLFGDGIEMGISPKVMLQIINLYSFDVDFQRDLRKGDKFEILIDSYYDKEGKKVKNGNVLYSSLDLQNLKKPLAAYLFKSKQVAEYFDAQGRSVRKSLLKTPINGARITSGFGFRKHPILGYRKQHKGLDFGAPSGTPILSAGAGIIEFIGRHGGYGNYVRIKHNPEFSTAYAHARGFARGLKKGSKVRQGQVIAYVGTTGRSTGPHLHYEILKRGTQINPATVKTVSGIKLGGKELTKFKAVKNDIDRMLKTTQAKN